MEFKIARNEFAVRFYQWSREDFRREIRQGLPFLASIKGAATLRFLEIWSSMSREEQTCLQSSFLKWAHPEAVEITGEYQTQMEKDLRQAYLKRAGQDSQLEREIWRRRFAGQGPVKRINRRKFVSNTLRELKPALGESFQKMAPNEIQYSISIGQWTINTWVTIGQPPTYFHYILAEKHTYLCERRDILSWLGVPGRLLWDCILDDDDAAGAAISMAELCSHFVSAVPSLLEGLSHDLPPDEPEPPPVPPKIKLVKKPRD